MTLLGSLFDGIGGWPLAAVKMGIKPVWSSEIEKFPIEVTKVRFPEMKHLGSVKEINGAEIEPVDIITSGSPCQDLSVAGNQKGFKGGRSGLFFDSVRVVREMRAATGGKFPRFYVWENVPGAFSANKGRDFLAVIEALTETVVPMPASGKWANAGMVRSGRCDIAWRVLDAQHWGVPQRRKRIFLIADFGAVGERRPEVFFKPEGLPRHYSQGEGAGQGAATAADGCFALAGNTIDIQPQNGGNGKGFQPDVSYTLTAMDRHAVARAYSFDSNASNSMKSCNPFSGCRPVDVSKTLDTTVPDPSKNQGGIAIMDRHAVAIRERCGCEGRGKGLLYGDDLAHTLNTGKDQFVQCYDISHRSDAIRENGQMVNTLAARMGTGGHNVPVVQAFSNSCFGGWTASETGQTLTAKGGGIGGGSNSLVNAGAVRRLTPLECERLQGLPDHYTLIPHKSCSDSARYKAIGNGMAQPCADYVMSVVKEMMGCLT